MVHQADRNVISSTKHPAVVEARRQLGHVGRGPASAFMADGHSMVLQALASELRVAAAFFLDPVEDAERSLLEQARAQAVEAHVLSRGVFFKLLGLGYETSVRVLAVVPRPALPDVAQLLDEEACILVGESIQDPRNVGVLIRTADAWGLSCAVFGQGSGDPFSRASVRSSTGSVFRVPIIPASRLIDYLEGLKGAGLRVVGSSARAEAPCWRVNLADPCAIVLGNESRGLSPRAAALCDEVVAIPMSGGAHSFNVTVAAGILLYERARQRALGSPKHA